VHVLYRRIIRDHLRPSAVSFFPVFVAFVSFVVNAPGHPVKKGSALELTLSGQWLMELA
jgi:hypothetical protein